MLKIIFQIAVLYVLLQYGLNVDINSKAKEYLAPLIGEAQDNLPEGLDTLLENLGPLSELTGDAEIVDLISEHAGALKESGLSIEDIQEKLKDNSMSIEELKEKLKEIQDKAKEATDKGN